MNPGDLRRAYGGDDVVRAFVTKQQEIGGPAFRNEFFDAFFVDETDVNEEGMQRLMGC